MNRFYEFLFASLLIFAMQFTTRAQCPNGLSPGTDNLVVNPDFSAGNASFTSQYNFCSVAGCLGFPGAEGSYTVDANPTLYNGSFVGIDHTTGTGDFLIVNGSPNTNTAVWCQSVTFEPNSYYIISFWVSSLVTQNPASIQLYINGFPYFVPITAPPNTGTWLQYSQTWQSGLNTTVDVCLYDMHTDIGGNDFGIDDISIKKCQCNLGVSAGNDKSMCVGDSVQLDGSGAAVYFWSPTNTLSCFTCANPYASPPATTTYTVSINGPGGCTAIDSATVTVYQHFDLHAGPDTTVCPGNSVQLHANGAVSYSWQPTTGLSDPNISNPLATPSQITTYYLSAVDSHGCNQLDSTTVKIFPSPPTVQVTPHDTTICIGGYAEFHVHGAGNYSWSPPQDLTCATCANVIATPPSSVTYTVTSIDSNGCDAGSDTARVNIDLSCSHIVIPSAFSPNGDGTNDLFHALSKGVTSFDLKVYNRWGEEVFSSGNPDSTWDGKLNGIAQPVGVYIYVLKATLDDGTVADKNGNVTLVR